MKLQRGTRKGPAPAFPDALEGYVIFAGSHTDDLGNAWKEKQGPSVSSICQGARSS